MNLQKEHTNEKLQREAAQPKQAKDRLKKSEGINKVVNALKDVGANSWT